jgi:Flp pilus assembly protein TadD
MKIQLMTYGIDVSRLWLFLAIAPVAFGLAACKSLNGFPSLPVREEPVVSAAAPQAAHSNDVPTGSPFQLGLEHFDRGDYGLAERHLRDAVEKSPKDAAAWIGLAASYDQIGRFDLADRAYRTATTLSGETAQILNNQGYSYMLRGNYAAARAKFRRAYRLDPTNPTIVNNIEILNSRERSRQRLP